MREIPILSVENLSVELQTGRHKAKLVRDVSFQIPRRKVLGLIGESGCGKSLTCLAIMGLLPTNIRRTDGKILLEERPISGPNGADFGDFRGKKAAMVLQNPMSCFDSVFTIRHHFKETLSAHGKPGAGEVERIAETALAEVGFDFPKSILDLYPFQMSGGMLQRVMLALAVMMDVSLLIADEPTTDLDVVSQARVLDLLSKIRDAHGMSILLVTHDLSVIARLADDVAVMRSGAIVESGKVGSIFANPRHSYTKALLDAHSSLYDRKLMRIFGIGPGTKQPAETANR